MISGKLGFGAGGTGEDISMRIERKNNSGEGDAIWHVP